MAEWLLNRRRMGATDGPLSEASSSTERIQSSQTIRAGMFASAIKLHLSEGFESEKGVIALAPCLSTCRRCLDRRSHDFRRPGSNTSSGAVRMVESILVPGIGGRHRRGAGTSVAGKIESGQPSELPGTAWYAPFKTNSLQVHRVASSFSFVLTRLSVLLLQGNTRKQPRSPCSIWTAIEPC